MEPLDLYIVCQKEAGIPKNNAKGKVVGRMGGTRQGGLWPHTGKKVIVFCSCLIFCGTVLAAFFFIVVHPVFREEVTSESGATDAERASLHAAVYLQNSSSFMVKMEGDGRKGPLIIGDSFANAKPFAILPGQEKRAVATLEGTVEKISISYVIHFPVRWSRESPYSILSGSFGVSSPVFFLFRSQDTPEAAYTVDFSSLPMKVYNSAFGEQRIYDVEGRDLFETYFVFGNYTKRCEKEYGDMRLVVISGGEFPWNDTICPAVNRIFGYYFREFGRPERALPRYTLGFFPARSYSSLASGFYDNRNDPRFVAHELLHLWQPTKYDCSGLLMYREGLVSFMQWYVLSEEGIISGDEMERLFVDERNKLMSLKDVRSLYYLQGDGLVDLRRLHPEEYDILVYSKSATLWKMLYDSGVPVADVFRGFLRTGDCAEMSGLLAEVEDSLYRALPGQP